MDTLTLQSRTADPFVVLSATGELDLHTQDVFEDVLNQHLAVSPVVVDLSGVDFLAISALRSLVLCHAKAGTAGHQLFFAEASQQALRLLLLAGLAEVLPIRDSVEQVVCDSVVLTRPAGSLVDEPLGELTKLDVG
jgi:anti-anti-sigma factor